MDLKVITDPEITLIAKTEVTPEGIELMKAFYREKNGLQERDNDPTIAELIEFAGRVCYDASGRNNAPTSTAEGYILNIIDQNHLSVLEHGNITFDVNGISRAASHEWVRHRHGSYSQESQRFVLSSLKSTVVVPPASYESGMTQFLDHGYEWDEADAKLKEFAAESYRADYQKYEQEYEILRAAGYGKKQASEAARFYIPNAAATRLVVTGNLRYWMEFLTKRDADGADAEIRNAAGVIGDILADQIPAVFGPEARSSWRTGNEQKGTK